ncbi:hypothetical protein BD626DRAFT_166252 [Schizophyllum amplum]|uniref:Uncharacterized protein n=1 Tax=Schizophyllum amplum TaxID=97359 RepID=A0A550CQ95_9AGAR|nr:hypothetical protein BD626DRAFT_166252 [Auriculariopsis ampla]
MTVMRAMRVMGWRESACNERHAVLIIVSEVRQTAEQRRTKHNLRNNMPPLPYGILSSPNTAIIRIETVRIPEVTISARTIYCRAVRIFGLHLVMVHAGDPAADVLAEKSGVLRDYRMYDDVDCGRRDLAGLDGQQNLEGMAWHGRRTQCSSLWRTTIPSLTVRSVVHLTVVDERSQWRSSRASIARSPQSFDL